MKLIRYPMIGLATITLWAALSLTALANPGLTVQNAILVADISPGDTITHEMNVSIGEADSPMDIAVEVQDLQGIDSSFSARGFVTLDQTSFHLKPGESQKVTATLKIPTDVGDGGRYAVIIIRQKPTGTGISIAVEVDVKVYLTIKNSQLIHKGEIVRVTADKAISGKPVDILVTLENTGNHHFKFKGEVSVSNAQGEVLDAIHTALSPASVIPSLSGELRANFIPEKGLPLGNYSVKARVILEDGTVLDEKEGSFELKEPYVPPPAPASLTLTPSSATTLGTPGGRISVTFAQGSVISQVEVLLRDYPFEQLPPPPSGFNLAITCFRVDGLAGLLTKEATMVVKYTAADLDKAGGDASRLRLARWDETDNQWTVLKTKVDKSAMTLTTNTNQLSIWAIMVSPPSQVGWVVPVSTAAGVIIIALLVFLFTRRRRGY